MGDPSSVGSVFRVKATGKWRYSFRYHGKYVVKSGYSTKKAASVAMQKKQSELFEHGDDTENRLFSIAYAEYLKDMAAENTPSVIQNKQAFAQRFNAHFGDMVIRKITELDVQRYKLDRKSSGEHSTGTIDNELSTLKHFFNWCMRKEYADRNPAGAVKKFNDDSDRASILTVEQARRLLSVADDDLRLRILLALGYGLRAAEIYNLRRDDVNYANGQISVHRLKKRRRVATILTLPRHLMDMVKLVAENNHKRSEYVFAFETCSGRFRQALMRADLVPTVRFHDLRHTAASWLLSNGLNLEQIRLFLGHGDIQTTQRYLHVEEKDVAEAGQELLRRLM